MITHKKRQPDTKPKLPTVVVACLLTIIAIFSFLTLQIYQLNHNQAPADADVALAVPDDVDISGEWVGTMTEDYNNDTRYDYRLVLDHEGDVVTGIGYQESTNRTNEIYAESTLSGDVEGYDVYYYETATNVLEGLSLNRWCRIEVSLNYQVIDGQETLIGTWSVAPDERALCDGIDGRVVLTRQTD